MENQPKSSNRTLTALLLLALLGSIGFNFYQWKSGNVTELTYSQQIDSLVVVRVDLERELTETGMELEKYRGLSEDLDSLLDEAGGKIKAQEKKIRDLIRKEGNSAKLNQELKAELAKLKELSNGYLERIDQLVTENNLLKQQNEELTVTVSSLNQEKAAMQDKINMGARIMTENMTLQLLKRKDNGKYTETSLLKRTNKLTMCFDLLENKLAQPGNKNVYVRILSPTGLPLGEGFGSIIDQDTKDTVYFAMKGQQEYEGSKQKVCLDYEEQDRILKPGKYTFEVYVDGYKSGVFIRELK